MATRITKSVYRSSYPESSAKSNFDIITVNSGKAKIESSYRDWDADDLRQLSDAALAAAEEVEAHERKVAKALEKAGV